MAFKKKDFSGKTEKECYEAALAKIYRCLSASEQSSMKLRKKMELEGYPSNAIESALEHASKIGILDDKRYCDMLVRMTISSGKGMNGCLKEIEALGIDPYELDSYMEYTDSGGEFELTRAMKFLCMHPPRAKDIQGSAYRKLVTKGYAPSIASVAAGRYARQIHDMEGRSQ